MGIGLTTSGTELVKNHKKSIFDVSCAFLNQFLTSRDVISQIFLFEVVADISVGVLNYVW